MTQKQKKIDLNPEELDYIRNEIYRRDYGEYVIKVHNGRYLTGAVTKYLAKEVQTFIETDTGHAYDVLVIDMPPQHGKSMTVTETLPSWYLGKYPFNKVIQASYSTPFAMMFSQKNNAKIKEYGKEIFGISIGSPDTQERFVLDNGVGEMISAGIMGGITGRGAKLVIIDDPIKNREEADSKSTRDKIAGEWLSSIKTRLAPGAKVIVIMTRWHKQDLAGYLMMTEKNIRVINLPVECDSDTDVLGRHRGDSLFPEIGRDNVWLQDFKQSYLTSEGSRAWNSLMMGKPSDEEGGIFKRGWFQFYTGHPLLVFKCITVDATFKDADSSDFVAIQVWGKTGTNHYLHTRIKKIMGFVETCKVLDQIIRSNMDYNMILIEDKANGSAIIDVFRRKYHSVIPVQPEGGKIARANAVSGVVEAKNVFVREEHGEFIDECCDFPNSDHDDEVDAFTQYLNKCRNVMADIPVEPDEDYLSEEDQFSNIFGFTE